MTESESPLPPATGNASVISYGVLTLQAINESWIITVVESMFKKHIEEYDKGREILEEEKRSRRSGLDTQNNQVHNFFTPNRLSNLGWNLTEGVGAHARRVEDHTYDDAR